MVDRSKRVIAAATDGACSGNPGPGGWGALIRFDDGSVDEFGGYEPETTNNRMELQAALFVLTKLKELLREEHLQIRTDSQYLINGYSKWIEGWKRKGWRTASGKSVLNQDLWQALDGARLADVSLEYVKGHSGDPDNDRVDEIAVSFSKGLKPFLRSNKGSDLLVANSADNSQESLDDLAPQKLHKLFSRLELIDRFAKKGYGISLDELASLLGEPISELKQRSTAWRWRDWVLEPLGEDRWRFLEVKTSTVQKDKAQSG